MVACHHWCAPSLSAWPSSFSIIIDKRSSTYYVDDLSSVVSYSTVKLFADDVTIYKEIACTGDVALLQHDLSSIVQWAKTWLLHLNPDKCQSIVLSNKHSCLCDNLEQVSPVPSYPIDIKLVSSTGMIIVSMLLPRLHGHLIFSDIVYFIVQVL